MLKNNQKTPLILNIKNRIAFTKYNKIYNKKLNNLFKINIIKGTQLINNIEYFNVNVKNIKSIFFFKKKKSSVLLKKKNIVNNCFLNLY